MKKFLNIFAVVSLSAVLLASCNTEQITKIYEPDGVAYSFINKAGNFTLPATNPVFSVRIFRNTTEGSGTVNIAATPSANVFTVPSTLTFEDGQGAADLTVSLTNEAAIGLIYNLKLTLSSEEVSVGGVGAIDLKVSLAYNWISLGNGQFYDSFTLYSIPTVEILQAEGFDRWRVMKPYTKELLLEAEWDGWLGGTQSDYIEFWVIDDEKHVKWDTVWYAGLLYQGGADDMIGFYYPSALGDILNVTSLDVHDAKSKFIQDKVVQLRPAVYIIDIGGWASSDYYSFVSLPGGPNLYDIL
ncbi:MAG: hypothetical protein KBC07_00015 [Bacteroidales bacterium]|jgi:hypothetical protein|nr:hypothetical protein [Bacteroidales bacterium]